MREIKFRGKNREGNWLYGNYYYDGKFHYILPFDNEDKYYSDYQVDENTIGQFTGLCDKNGKEIYDGGIIEFEYHGSKFVKEVYWDIEWNCWKVYIDGGNIHTLNSHSIKYLIPIVIGNIHEVKE